MPSRILIVDDDADLLKLLQIRLAANGYEVSCATSGEEALARVAAARPDLVITDLRMDGMDGMALFEALHQGRPGLPVIHADGAWLDSRCGCRHAQGGVWLSDQTF
jgi:two-component system response regulator GlrR